MEKSSNSLLFKCVLPDNMLTIHDCLNNSYQHAKQQLHDSVSYIKTELTSIQNRGSFYFTKMILPVNNFLKSIGQIESEFKQQQINEDTHSLPMNGEMVPSEKVLGTTMEENY